MKYRSKPVEVEAVQFTLEESRNTILYKLGYDIRNNLVFLSDWIIKDGDTFSVCSDEEFKRRYEAV